MTKWSVDPKASIKTLQSQIAEMEQYQKTGHVDGKSYHDCKVCGELVMRLSNDYSKEGYCSECWVDLKKKEIKEKWSNLIGFNIVAFEIELSEFTTESPRLGKIVLEKDGVKKVLKAEEIVHLIIQEGSI